MADPSVYIFELRDEGTANPRPGAAAQASQPGGQPTGPATPRGPGDAAGPAGRPGVKSGPGEPERFGQAILDAMKQASRYSSFNSATSAAGKLLRPLIDAGQLIQDLFGHRSGAGRAPEAGAAAATPLPTPPIPPLGTQTPQTFQLQQAVFNAEGAKIVIVGGQIVQQNGGLPPNTPGSAGRGLFGTNGGQLSKTGPESPGRDLPRLPSPGGALSTEVLEPELEGTRVTLLGVQSAAAETESGLAAAGATAGAAAVPLAALVIGAGLAVRGLQLLYNRATEQAKSLANYDATLAAAQARSQIAAIKQDLESASYLGNELARLTDAQTKVAVNTQRILDVLEKTVLTALLPLIESVAGGVETIANNPLLQQALANLLLLIPVLRELKIAIDLLNLFRGSEEKEADRKALDSNFFAIFEKLKDLGIDDPAGREPAAGTPRNNVEATGFGNLPMI